MTHEVTSKRGAKLRIAPILLESGYARGAGPCSCTSVCCKRGAYVDVQERDLVLQHQELVLRHMDASQNHDPTSWFETDEKLDPDYPSGRSIGTAEVNGKCAFLDSRGLCSLQLAATSEGKHKWALKPLYCVLYPIEVSDNVIKFDPRLQGQQSCCSVAPSFEVPLFEACREELVHLVGESGFEQIEQQFQARDSRHDASNTSSEF